MSGDEIVKSKDRILYIEPNDLPAFMSATSSNGQNLDNISWDPEKLGIYVDLQVVIPSRQYNKTQDYNFSTYDDSKSWNKYESIFSGVRMSKDDRYLTADWTNVSYQEIKNNRAGSKELLGINSINIIFDSHMYPVVTMNFTDVRGASLMMPEEQKYVDLNGDQVKRDEEVTKSFFSHIFRFPYPRFLLSVKGPYGTCVTFVLSVMDFKSTFNSETGNFDVVIKFIGNMYGLYTDIPMNYLIVAPYIGSPEGEYKLNEHWKDNPDFVFADAGGTSGKICTFVEFYDAYMNNGGDQVNLSENIVQTSNNNANKDVLETLLSSHYAAFERVVEGYGGADSGTLFVNLDKTKVLFFNYDPNVKKQFAVTEFMSFVSDYQTSFPVSEGGFDFTKDYGVISDIYKGDHTRHVDASEVQFTVNAYRRSVNKSGDTICEGLTADESKKIRLNHKNYENYNSAFVYTKEFENDIRSYIAKLNADNNERTDKVAEEVKENWKNVFGFAPTIENFMRMIFAHLDTFLYYVYEDCLNHISTSRTLATLGGFPKALTDIESTSKGSAHVPPFTAFFKENDGKCERMFPGDDPKLANIPEVNLVNGILSAVGSTARRVAESGYPDEYGDDEKDTNGDVKSDGVDESAEIYFSPVSPYDMYYNGVNPYDYLTGAEGSLDLTSYFLYRVEMASSCYKYDESTLIQVAKADAENFKKSKHFSTFKRNRDDFKTSLEEIKKCLSGDNKATVFNKFFNDHPELSTMELPLRVGGPGSSENNFQILLRTTWDDIPLCLKGITHEFGSYKKDAYPFELKLGDDYLTKFLEKIPGSIKNTEAGKRTYRDFANFDHKNSVFFPSNKHIWGLGGKNTPIVPIGYTKRFIGMGAGNVPKYDSPSEVPIPFIRPTEPPGVYIVENLMSASENNLYKDINLENKMSYGGDAGKFVANAETKYMWAPVVFDTDGTNQLCKSFDKNDSELLVKAFLFLDGLLLGESHFDSKGDRGKIYASYVSLLNNYVGIDTAGENIARFSKMTRAEFLFICGLCYASYTPEDSIWDELTKRGVDTGNLGKLFNYGSDSVSFDTNLVEVFENWARNEFANVFGNGNSVSGKYIVKDRNGSDKETIIRYRESFGKKIDKYILPNITGDTESATENENEMVRRNEFTVRLVKETITTFFPSKDIPWTLPVSVLSTFVNEVLKYLGEESNGESQDESNTTTPEVIEGNFYESFDSADMKNVVYYTLKNLYDRWLSMHTYDNFKLHSPSDEKRFRKRRITNGDREKDDVSEFSNFVYVDTFYNDISKKFLVNPATVFKLIGDQLDGTVSYNILEFIGRICQDNKLLFRCLPVYSNIYDSATFAEIFKPHSLYDGTSKTGRRIGNTYLIMYTYEPSHYLDVPQDQNDGVSYANDSFDIADTLGEITQEALEVMKKKNEDGDENYSICAFGVTPAKQNQSYFTKVSVSMESPRVTDFSIMNKFKLAQLSQRGGTSNIAGAGQNMYSIYSNRAYDCNVEMLGCANIMPMMYFQLNNVPMFKGAYMITKVEHNIQNNHMTTKFVGTRMPKRYIPFTKDAFMVGAISAALNEAANWRVRSRWGGTPVDLLSNDEWNARAAALGITEDMHDDAAPRLAYERGMITTLNDLPGYSGTVQIHVGLADDLRAIFKEISELEGEKKFYIKAVAGWRSYDSVTKTYNSGGNLGNNTSLHCFGCAVDINGGNVGNPWFNYGVDFNDPEPKKGAMKPANDPGLGTKSYSPPSGGYDPSICTWHYGHPVVEIFRRHGWGWGGSYGDVMHFSIKGGK